jgi:type I restriction enzyme S subunit
MKFGDFFDKFDQFTDAPDAVAKMRELVLRLAVTGKLVRQNKRDLPASSLLESVAAERARLVETRRIRARPTAPAEADEQPYALPASWAWVRLSDVGYELGQKAPDKSFTYIDVGSIDSKNGRIGDRIEELQPNEAPSRARKLVARGTVIYSTVRPYLRNIAIVDRDFDPEPIASTAFGVLHPFEGINNRYLFYWLRSAQFTAYVQETMKGMAYPAINDEKFYSGPVALPPLAEQKRIVSEVDELMTLCDRLEEQQQERDKGQVALSRASLARFAEEPTTSNLDFLFHPSYSISTADLRRSILSLSVQGKLVPPDRKDGDVDNLLERNDERRRRAAQHDHRADIENQVLLSAEDRWRIPETWSWRGLADLVLFVDYRGKTPVKRPGGVRLLTAKNVRRGQISLAPEEFISEDNYQNWMTRGIPKGGDVLFTTEAPMGNAAVIKLTERFALAQRVICFQSYGALDPHFLVMQILSDQFQIILDKNGTGMTAKGIKASKLKRLPLAVPPLAEQCRIVAKVDELMTLVDQLEAQLTDCRVTAANVLDALVAELTVASGVQSGRSLR